MIYCPECGTANREGSRFCNQCGSRLAEEVTSKCPRCGEANPAGAPHCQSCGFDLARPADAPPEEPVPGDRLPAPQEGAEGEAAAAWDAGLPPWLDSVERSSDDLLPSRANAEGPGELDDLEPAVPPSEWSADAIPIEPIVGVPYRAHERSGLPPTAEQTDAAALFGEIASGEESAAPQQVLAPRRRLPMGLGLRWLIVLAVLLGVSVPLLWPSGLLGATGDPPAPAVAAAKAIGELRPGTAVLVAFEYDAGLAGDLQPVAEAYLRQLLGQQVRVLAVSTQPEGAALAQMALDRVLPAYPKAGYGRTVLNLGYVAGGETAVRALAGNLAAAAPTGYEGTPLAGTQAMQGLTGAGALPLVVVLGRDLVAVQRWIEQVGGPYGTPIVVGVPSLVEPALGPYWRAGQVRGVVGGVAGAAAYERLQGTSGAAGQLLGGLQMGIVVVAAMVASANIGLFFASLSRRRR